jgi:hypothetical protein
VEERPGGGGQDRRPAGAPPSGRALVEQAAEEQLLTDGSYDPGGQRQERDELRRLDSGAEAFLHGRDVYPDRTGEDLQSRADTDVEHDEGQQAVQRACPDVTQTGDRAPNRSASARRLTRA